jgi:hypothetical protein
MTLWPDEAATRKLGKISSLVGLVLGEFYLDSHITKLSPNFWVKGTIHPKTGSFSPGLGFTVMVHYFYFPRSEILLLSTS